MTKRKLFVLADSISIHYGPFLKSFIEENYELSRKGDEFAGELEVNDPRQNGEDSDRVLEYARARFSEDNFRPDAILLNCGLHDVKYNEGKDTAQVPLERYKKNLHEAFEFIRSKGTKIFWVSVTPVDEEHHNRLNPVFRRYEKDVLEYYKISNAIAKEHAVTVIDLHQFTQKLNIPLYCDHVHFNEEVRKLQAAYIAGWLNCDLE